MISTALNLLFEGGPLVVPLFFISVLGLAVVLERLVYWNKLTQNYSSLDVEKTYTFLVHKQYDYAKEIFESSEDPSLLCLKHCFASKGKIHPQILKSLGYQFLDRSKKNLRLLETVITISPLIGILGTVFGIIVSIKSLGTMSDLSDPKIMISGLSQALVTTALGLLISIVFFVFYNHFLSRHEALKAKLERDLSAFESLG